MKAELREILGTLSREELEELVEVAMELLDEKEAQEAKEGGRTQRVHYELKWIPRGKKLHGPYIYARWWEDGKHKSKYLGKAQIA